MDIQIERAYLGEKYTCIFLGERHLPPAPPPLSYTYEHNQKPKNCMASKTYM